MFECEKCGARNFRTLQALGSHRSSGNCRAAARVQVGNNQAGRAASSSQPDFPACDPPEARGNAGQHAAAAADEDAQDSKRQRVEQPEEREAPGNAADLAEQGPAPSAAGSDPSLGRFFLAPEEDPERERFRELRELHQHLLDLSTFVRSVLNGQGLPRPDIQRLLDYVHSAGFDASKLPDTVAQLEKFEDENLYSESEGWETHNLTQPGDPYKILLRCRKDRLGALKELLSNEGNGPGFAYRPERTTDDQGHRTVSSPQTASWWHDAQGRVNVACLGAYVAALIFYSDETTLSNDRRTHGWPLVLTLGNIPIERRNELGGHVLLGIFPILHAVPDCAGFKAGSPEFILRKLQIFQKCLEIILEPFKTASKHGMTALDPHSDEKVFFPLLYAYICDHPESCKVTCTKDTMSFLFTFQLMPRRRTDFNTRCVLSSLSCRWKANRSLARLEAFRTQASQALARRTPVLDPVSARRTKLSAQDATVSSTRSTWFPPPARLFTNTFRTTSCRCHCRPCASGAAPLQVHIPGRAWHCGRPPRTGCWSTRWRSRRPFSCGPRRLERQESDVQYASAPCSRASSPPPSRCTVGDSIAYLPLTPSVESKRAGVFTPARRKWAMRARHFWVAPRISVAEGVPLDLVIFMELTSSGRHEHDRQGLPARGASADFLAPRVWQALSCHQRGRNSIIPFVRGTRPWAACPWYRRTGTGPCITIRPL